MQFLTVCLVGKFPYRTAVASAFSLFLLTSAGSQVGLAEGTGVDAGLNPVLRGVQYSLAPTNAILSTKSTPSSMSTGSTNAAGASATRAVPPIRQTPETGWQAALAEGQKRLKTKELVPAEICFREAVRDVQKNKANSPDDIVLCLESLAAVLQTEDKTEEVIPLYKKSLRILQRHYGKESEKTVNVRVRLGDVERNESLYRRAAKYYRPALVILDKTPGEADTVRYAEIEHRLGLALFKGGLPVAAEKNYDAALSLMMQQKRLPDEGVLEDLLSDYIDLLRKTASASRVAKSDFQKELLKDQIDTLSRTKNVDDSYWSKQVSVNIFNPDAVTKNAQDKLAQAQSSSTPLPPVVLDKTISDSAALDQINQQRVQFYERMIAIDINTLGAQHPSVARDLTGLAYVYLSQNHNDQAKIVLERALQIYKTSYANDLLVKRTEKLLALIERGRQAQSGDGTVQNYLESLPSIPAEAQNIEVSLRLNYLGLLCFSQGKMDHAEKIYPWALAATALACGEQSSMAGTCLNDYAVVLREAGLKSEAEQYERTAGAIISRALAKQAASALP